MESKLMIHVISLGAGVQSSTMALMAKHGELGYDVDCAIFADTGAEPEGVYTWLDWLETQIPFPVYRVSHGNLYEHIMRPDTDKSRFVSVPFYTDASGRAGMTRRQCTREYKIAPLQKKQRELIGLKKGQHGPKHVALKSLIGISLDEMQRMKDSGKGYIENVWPLIDLRMTRRDCLQWMTDKGYPEPTKSACTFCPYHDNEMWRDMRDNDPTSWDQAVEVDRHLRSGSIFQRKLGSDLYLHNDLVPLEDVDLQTPEDRGQINFLDECDGMCGV